MPLWPWCYTTISNRGWPSSTNLAAGPFGGNVEPNMAPVGLMRVASVVETARRAQAAWASATDRGTGYTCEEAQPLAIASLTLTDDCQRPRATAAGARTLLAICIPEDMSNHRLSHRKMLRFE